MRDKDSILLENLYRGILLNESSDEEYLRFAQNPEENEERLQKMVNNAAENKGLIIGLSHTGSGKFNVYDMNKARHVGMHFGTSDQASAMLRKYKKGEPSFTQNVAINVGNAIRVNDGGSTMYDNRLMGGWSEGWPKAVFNGLKEAGYKKAEEEMRKIMPSITADSFEETVSKQIREILLRNNIDSLVYQNQAEGSSPYYEIKKIGDFAGTPRKDELDYSLPEGTRLSIDGEYIYAFDKDGNELGSAPARHGLDKAKKMIVAQIKFNKTKKEYYGDDSVIVLRPNQIKSADPITYDDGNNIIPLSQRFDSSKDDIRY